MIRIQFPTDADRVRGNYLLATRAVVRWLRGQLFELTERELRLLVEQRIPYTVVSIPEPSGSDLACEIRLPLNDNDGTPSGPRSMEFFAMTPTLHSLGIDRMSVEDRIALATAILDSIATDSHPPLLTEAQRLELERRLADLAAHPDEAVPWKQVKAEALARFRG